MSFLSAYRGRTVLVTGATGFKGAWLSAWLTRLGARVHGFSLPPERPHDLYTVLGLEREITHTVGDVRDGAAVAAAIERSRPDVIFHLAAQALVRPSYADPLGTFATNVMGTAHLLEALRRAPRRTAVVVVTSDKCYENVENGRAYVEGDALGGADPYSASKGAAEIVVASYRRSFFSPSRFTEHGIAIATARAGNVVGPGDRSPDRLVPDVIAALSEGRAVAVRNPRSVRPWQHVLEPLAGYLELGARLLGDDAAAHCEAWNFGPPPDAARPVRDLVEAMIASWGGGTWHDASDGSAVPEAGLLHLAIDKATSRLSWRPRWSFEEMVHRTVLGYRGLERGERSIVTTQIEQYEAPSASPAHRAVSA